MASTVLPQAMVSIPRATSSIYSSNNLGISTIFPSHLSSFKSIPITRSRVSSTKLSSTISPIIISKGKRSVLVKSESNSEETEAKNEEPEVEVEEESVAVAVAEAEVKPPRKPRVKLGDIMGILNKRAIEASNEVRPTPDLRPGDILEIKFEVPENRRRASIYKGIVISKQNAGIHTTIRIRRIIAGGGVEIVFPVYSPNIKEIKVVRHRKVRRAKLYYLRDKLPRLSTFK
ncbi:hypothetical protein AQUCO_05300042v1 [Aquilegia coerulea]|uniref:Uncharacterized protein n=1 Tax=Aquilegia coerulea TaxID=218851 RepID=A0A2G5CI36_AQUCA|nr:hypothetical protein AQUCO_05300042v1 [Aquilegia coerulea]